VLAPRPLFQQGVKAPWKLALSNEKQQLEMTSSRVELENITMKTTDRRIQEDSLAIRWLNSELASVELISPFPTDLLSYLEADASLVFDVKLDRYNATPVLIEMNCADECQGTLDLKAQFEQLQPGVWQSISIDLSCFAKQGVNLGKVFTPFKLTASKGLALTLGEIHISAEPTDETLTLQCEN
jgi:beta-glucosidase